MNSCKILFSILDKNSFNAIGLLPLFYATIVLLANLAASKNTFQKITGVFFFVSFAFINILGIIGSYSNVHDLKKIYNDKKYKEIQGKITDFKRDKIKPGYTIVSFKVKGVEFKYTNIYNGGGFNDTKKLNNGDYVKIRYINRYYQETQNYILYLQKCKGK